MGNKVRGVLFSPCANALPSLAVLSLAPGSAGIMDLGAHQTHFCTALEKERGFFDDFSYPPSRYYIFDKWCGFYSFTAFTVAEFGCKLEGTSRSAQRDSSFHQVCPHLEMESGSASLRLAALWLLPRDLK